MAFVERTSRSPYANNKYPGRWNNKWYPWPYSASEDTISNISQGRMLECVTFKRCGTCGLPVEEECVGLIIYNPHSPDVMGKTHKEKAILHMESGPYHLKCLELNFAKCPHLAATKIYLPAYGKWSDVRQQILDEYK